MSTIFQPITLNWSGTDYVIEADHVMGAIAAIEDVVTLDELHACRPRSVGGRGMRLTTIARGYGAALRYAGAAVSDEQVYASLFGDNKSAQRIMGTLNTLILMMVPPSEITKGVAVAKPGNRKGRARGSSSSRQPSRPA